MHELLTALFLLLATWVYVIDKHRISDIDCRGRLSLMAGFPLAINRQPPILFFPEG